MPTLTVPSKFWYGDFADLRTMVRLSTLPYGFKYVDHHDGWLHCSAQSDGSLWLVTFYPGDPHVELIEWKRVTIDLDDEGFELSLPRQEWRAGPRKFTIPYAV